MDSFQFSNDTILMNFLDIFFLGKFESSFNDIRRNTVKLINGKYNIIIMLQKIFREINMNFVNIFVGFNNIFNLINLIRIHGSRYFWFILKKITGSLAFNSKKEFAEFADMIYNFNIFIAALLWFTLRAWSAICSNYEFKN